MRTPEESPALADPGEVITMGLFGKTKMCNHQSSAPFKARCTKPPGHRGDHEARGLRWSTADGRIKFGRKGGKK